jgi:hypothetical protein
MKDKLLFIGLPIALTVVFLMHWVAAKQEGFQVKDTSIDLPNLDSCPGDLVRATDSSAVICCEGQVEGGKCQGTPKCTLSAAAAGLPRCVDYLKTSGLSNSTRFCPPSMPNYYEIAGKGMCTAGALKVNGTGPVDAGAEKCKVLATPEERAANRESCYNKRLLEEFKVTKVQGPVTKMIEPGFKTRTNFVPSFLIALYGESKFGQRKTCLDRKTGEAMFDVRFPGWRSGNNADYNAGMSEIVWCN